MKQNLKILLLLFFCISALIFSVPVSAQDTGISPEQRQELLQRFKERWNDMSPEQQEQARQRMQERGAAFRKRLQQMSPEQRQQLFQRFRERRGGFNNGQ